MRFFYIYLVLLVLIGTGCTVRITWPEQPNPGGNLPTVVESPTSTQRPATVTPQPTASATATRTPTPTQVICRSPLETGPWNGEVELRSTASRSGLQIIRQQAVIELDLEIGCQGQITGTAIRTGEAFISVPILVNGTCQEEVQYNVLGNVFGTEEQPELEMRFTAKEGQISCDVSSRTAQIPSGKDATDLRGYSFLVQIFPDLITEDRLEGDDWPDRLYQDQLPTLEELIEDANLAVVESSSWYLERQGR
jgi:hypothetical protein